MASSKADTAFTPDGIQKARDELTALFRRIGAENQLSGQRWNMLIEEFVRNYDAASLNNPRDRSYARGNISSQLLDTHMTWKVFMDGLRFLNPDKATIAVEMDWGDGTVSKHQLPIQVRAPGVPPSQLRPTPIEKSLVVKNPTKSEKSK